VETRKQGDRVHGAISKAEKYRLGYNNDYLADSHLFRIVAIDFRNSLWRGPLDNAGPPLRRRNRGKGHPGYPELPSIGD
jgi:hypothetical protein